MKARFVTTLFILAALFAALALASGVGAMPAAAATMNPENSYLVCQELHRAAALYYPYDPAPRYNIYAWRIDGGPWTYVRMYFSHGQEWQRLNGKWVATTTNWHAIWAPDDGYGHLIEVYESRSKNNKKYSPWIRVASPCRTGTLWSPYRFYNP